jgi:hypothetical protein
VLLQLTDAMHAVGDVELKAKFEKVCCMRHLLMKMARN